MGKIDASKEVVAYLGLGSNLDRPLLQLKSARAVLGAQSGIREVAFSSFYRSAPMGPADQPDYVNAVMQIATTLAPMALLGALQTIETEHGRVRQGERWGQRTLDLDLLLYADLVIASEVLSIPHPGIAEREFVLYPLAEIAPADLVIPGKGPLNKLVENCPRRGLEIFEHA